jgi:hypothetical protein
MWWEWNGLDMDSPYTTRQRYAGPGQSCWRCTRPIIQDEPTFVAVKMDDQTSEEILERHKSHGVYNGNGGWCRHCYIRWLVTNDYMLQCPSCPGSIKFAEMRHRGEVFCLRHISPLLEGFLLRTIGILPDWSRGRFCEHDKTAQCHCRDCYCDACMSRAPNPQLSQPVQLWNAIQQCDKQVGDGWKDTRQLWLLSAGLWGRRDEMAYIRRVEALMERELTMQEEYLLWCAVQSFRIVPNGDNENVLKRTQDPAQLPSNRFLTSEERSEKIARRLVHHPSGSERLTRYRKISGDIKGFQVDAYEIPVAEMDDDLMSAIYALEKPKFLQLFGENRKALLAARRYPANSDTMYFVEERSFDSGPFKK